MDSVTIAKNRLKYYISMIITTWRITHEKYGDIRTIETLIVALIKKDCKKYGIKYTPNAILIGISFDNYGNMHAECKNEYTEDILFKVSSAEKLIL